MSLQKTDIEYAEHLLHHGNYNTIKEHLKKYPRHEVIFNARTSNQDAIRYAIIHGHRFRPKLIESRELAELVKYDSIRSNDYCKLSIKFCSQPMIDIARTHYPKEFNTVSNVKIHARSYGDFVRMRNIVNTRTHIEFGPTSRAMIFPEEG